MPQSIFLVKNLGTMKLLQLTKDLSEEDQRELLSYIGNLEKSQRVLAETINNMPKIVEDW